MLVSPGHSFEFLSQGKSDRSIKPTVQEISPAETPKALQHRKVFHFETMLSFLATFQNIELICASMIIHDSCFLFLDPSSYCPSSSSSMCSSKLISPLIDFPYPQNAHRMIHFISFSNGHLIWMLSMGTLQGVCIHGWEVNTSFFLLTAEI